MKVSMKVRDVMEASSKMSSLKHVKTERQSKHLRKEQFDLVPQTSRSPKTLRDHCLLHHKDLQRFKTSSFGF